MSKRKSSTDWEGKDTEREARGAAGAPIDQDGYEVVSSGTFPPMWKPERDGEAILIMPGEFRILTMKQGKKTKENASMDCIFRGGSSESFFVGSGKASHQQAVSSGDFVTLPMSYNLMGENRLAVQEDEEDISSIRLSALSRLSVEESKPLKIIFTGKAPIGGGRSVKGFTISAPAGFKERIQKDVLEYNKKTEKKK